MIFAALAGAVLCNAAAEDSSADPGNWTLKRGLSELAEIRTVLDSQTDDGSILLREGYVYLIEIAGTRGNNGAAVNVQSAGGRGGVIAAWLDITDPSDSATKIDFLIGDFGDGGAGGTGNPISLGTYGGAGGGATVVIFDGTTIMVAGGGGGGGAENLGNAIPGGAGGQGGSMGSTTMNLANGTLYYGGNGFAGDVTNGNGKGGTSTGGAGGQPGNKGTAGAAGGNTLTPGAPNGGRGGSNETGTGGGGGGSGFTGGGGGGGSGNQGFSVGSGGGGGSSYIYKTLSPGTPSVASNGGAGYITITQYAIIESGRIIASDKTVEYNGSPQTIIETTSSVLGLDTGFLPEIPSLYLNYTYTSSGGYNSTVAPTDAGVYSVTVDFSYKTGRYYFKSPDGPITVSLTIVPKKLKEPSPIIIRVPRTGSQLSLPLKDFDLGTMDIIGHTGTDVGFYSAIISLKDKNNYNWAGGGTGDITIIWEIVNSFGVSGTVTFSDPGNPGHVLDGDPISDAVVSYYIVTGGVRGPLLFSDPTDIFGKYEIFFPMTDTLEFQDVIKEGYQRSCTMPSSQINTDGTVVDLTMYFDSNVFFKVSGTVYFYDWGISHYWQNLLNSYVMDLVEIEYTIDGTAQTPVISGPMGYYEIIAPSGSEVEITKLSKIGFVLNAEGDENTHLPELPTPPMAPFPPSPLKFIIDQDLEQDFSMSYSTEAHPIIIKVVDGAGTELKDVKICFTALIDQNEDPINPTLPLTHDHVLVRAENETVTQDVGGNIFAKIVVESPEGRVGFNDDHWVWVKIDSVTKAGYIVDPTTPDYNGGDWPVDWRWTWVMTDSVNPANPLVLTFVMKEGTVVTFDPNNGTDVEWSILVMPSSKLDEPVGYTNLDLSLVGWFADGSAVPWNFNSDTVSGDMKLTAMWGRKVTFGLYGGVGSIEAEVETLGISSPAAVFEGKTVNFKATPDTGWRVKDWYVDGAAQGSTSMTFSHQVNGNDVFVQVEFEQIFTVTYGLYGGVGTITGAVSAVNIGSSPATVVNGKTVVFTATPDVGWRVKDWYLNGTAVGTTSSSYSHTVAGADATIQVLFEQIFTVTFGIYGGVGTIGAMVDAVAISSPAIVVNGKTVNFTATPDTGWRVKDWYVDGVSKGNTSTTFSYPVNGNDVFVQVEFEQIFTVTFGIYGGVGTIGAMVDAVAISSPATVVNGKTVVFTATPDVGWRVKDWYLNGIAVGSISTSLLYTVHNADATIQVMFEQIFTITYGLYGGVGSISGAVAAADIGSSPATVVNGSTVVFTAAPDTGWRVKEWYLNGTAVGSTSSTYSYVIAGADATIQVLFEQLFTITYGLYVGVGSVSGAVAAVDIGSSPATVVNGSTIIFTATPDTGWRVKDWYLNGTAVGSTSATYSHMVAGADATIQVMFEQIFAITYGLFGGVGSVSGAISMVDIGASPATVVNGSTIIFTATPDPGWRVKEWYVDGTAQSYTSTTFTYPVNGNNVIVQVEFEQIFTITYGLYGGVGTIAGAVASVDIGASPATVVNGSTIVFTATPDVGWRVKEWYLNGTAAGSTSATYSHSVAGADATIQVLFEQIFTVTFGLYGGVGTIGAMVDAAAISSPAIVVNGKTVNFTATPDTGWRVKDWYVDGAAQGSTSTTFSHAVNGNNAFVQVQFEQIFTVTFGIYGGVGTIGATVDAAAISSPEIVVNGKTVNFTATPDPGWRVKDWYVDGAAQGSTSATFSYPVNGNNVFVQVEFEQIFTLTYGVSAGSGTISAKINDVDVGPSPATVVNGSNVDFTATPTVGWIVLDWYVNGTAQSSRSATFFCNIAGADVTIQVEFEQVLIIMYGVFDGSGTITAVKGGIDIGLSPSSVVSGETLDFTAAPEAGWRIKEWYVDGVAQNNNSATFSYTIAGSDVTVQVEFERIQSSGHQYYITATSDAGATITPSGRVTVNGGGSQTFSFAAKDGFRIASVTIDGHFTLSQAQIDSGSYTFYNVLSDHTIDVRTVAGHGGEDDDGEGGDGGDGSDVIDYGKPSKGFPWMIIAVIALAILIGASLYFLIIWRIPCVIVHVKLAATGSAAVGGVRMVYEVNGKPKEPVHTDDKGMYVIRASIGDEFEVLLLSKEGLTVVEQLPHKIRIEKRKTELPFTMK